MAALLGERVGDIIEDLRGLAGLGMTVAHGGLRNAWDVKQFEIFKNEVVPAAEAL